MAGTLQLFELWQKDKSIIPGFISEKNPDRYRFGEARQSLKDRKQSILNLAVLSHLERYLDREDFSAALQSTVNLVAGSLAIPAQHAVPPGVTLDGSVGSNWDWLSSLFRSQGYKRFCKALDKFSGAESNWLRRNLQLNSSWTDDQATPQQVDLDDFQLWWNRAAAIDALLVITAGANSWSEFVSRMRSDHGPLHGTWRANAAFFPTSLNVSVYLHTYPELCELLALGKIDDTRHIHYWSLKLDCKNLGGNHSQSAYQTATGLTVGHLYLIVLLERLGLSAGLKTGSPDIKARTFMENQTVTETAELARQTAIRMLRDSSGAASSASTSHSGLARRFAPPQDALPQAHGVAHRTVAARSLTSEQLAFQPALSGPNAQPWWKTASLGSISLSADELSPTYGLSLVRLYATVVFRGLQNLPIELIDDEEDPDRVHLIPIGLSKFPGVDTPTAELTLVDSLRLAMARARWALTLEPDYERVANLGLALEVNH